MKAQALVTGVETVWADGPLTQALTDDSETLAAVHELSSAVF